MPPVDQWQPLLSVQAEAAATLMGLTFVAVSINLKRILEIPGAPGRAAESLFYFLQVFFVCTVTLIPGQPAVALGLEILSIALASWLLQVTTQIRYAKSRTGHPLLWLIIRVAITQLAAIPFIVAALYLYSASPTALYWLVPGFVFSFIGGVLHAWILLVEILR